MSTIRVLLADDHKIIREGLKGLIKKEAGMEVIAEAENGRDAVRLAKKLKPNVIVMDVSMPEMNGTEAARKIKEETPDIRIVALSMHTDRKFVLGMIEAGASGYVLKDCAFEELAKAIRNVARGNTYISPVIAEVVVEGYLHKTPGQSCAMGSILTPREREILKLVAEGKSSKEIAAQLNISAKTVETHRRNMMARLKIKTIAELTKYALREGFVSIEG